MFTSSRFAPFCTCSRAMSTGLEVAALDQTPELLRARDVLSLAHHHESRVGADDERFETAERREGFRGSGDLTWWQIADRARDLPDVLRGGPAAPSEHVGEPGIGELAQVAARDL